MIRRQRERGESKARRLLQSVHKDGRSPAAQALMAWLPDTANAWRG